LSARGEAGERARCDIANGSILRVTWYGLAAYRVSDKKKREKKEVYYSILYLHARCALSSMACTTTEVSRSPPNAASPVRYEG